MAEINDTQIESQVFRESYNAPTANSSTIERLANCIEDAEDLAAKDISTLISELQVQEARLRSLDLSRRNQRELVLAENIEEHGLDAVCIYARAQRLLLYARREDVEYFATPFRDIIHNNCHFMIEALGIENRVQARMNRIGADWLGN